MTQSSIYNNWNNNETEVFTIFTFDVLSRHIQNRCTTHSKRMYNTPLGRYGTYAVEVIF